MFYVLLANGFEETEALVPVDLLRRAGVAVKTVGISGKTVIGSKNIIVQADILPEEMDLNICKGIMLPGGMPGTENLYDSDIVRQAVQYCVSQDLLLCSICAAPTIPGRMGLLKDKKAICFPGCESKLDGACLTDAPVVQDGIMITAKGAGCVFAFSHKIISALLDHDTADRVIAQIQYADM